MKVRNPIYKPKSTFPFLNAMRQDFLPNLQNALENIFKNPPLLNKTKHFRNHIEMLCMQL